MFCVNSLQHIIMEDTQSPRGWVECSPSAHGLGKADPDGRPSAGLAQTHATGVRIFCPPGDMESLGQPPSFKEGFISCRY